MESGEGREERGKNRVEKGEEREKRREERKDHSLPLPGRAGAAFHQSIKEGLQ